MPTWFNPLLLVVALSGFVFLFLQGRLLFAALHRLAARQSAIEDRLTALAKDMARPLAPAASPVLQMPDDVRDLPKRVNRGFEATQVCLDGLNQRLASCETELGSLRLSIERVAERPDAAGPSMEANPIDVARRFLLEEGFRSLHLDAADEPPAEDGAVRIFVRAQYGDQLRSGQVTVRNGRVADAQLEVPSGFFP